MRDARHLETPQFPGDVIVLGNDFETYAFQQRSELARIRRTRTRRERFRLGGVQLRAVHPPDTRRIDEQCRLAGEHACIVFRQHMELVDALLARPRHRLAQGARCFRLDQHPPAITGSARRASRKSGRCAGVDAKVVAHERRQLRL